VTNVTNRGRVSLVRKKTRKSRRETERKEDIKFRDIAAGGLGTEEEVQNKQVDVTQEELSKKRKNKKKTIKRVGKRSNSIHRL